MSKYEAILDELGMKMSIKGYTYWLAAIEYCMGKIESEGYAFCMSEVYNYIAEKYNTTYSRAERALRHAVEYTPGIEQKIQEKLKINYKLKNSDFLACLVKLARMEME